MPWLMGFLVLKYAFHLINGLKAMKVGEKANVVHFVPFLSALAMPREGRDPPKMLITS